MGRATDRGLIPAHAGKTVSVPNLSLKGTAHPRSRGENVRTHARASWLRGSSPLTRGKRTLSGPPPAILRLIPAHAGKTDRAFGRTSDRTAHPRSRGENAVMNHPAAAALGSSPLTRGKPSHPARRGPLSGLIPAHAGKTASSSSVFFVLRAHPRSRGENYPCYRTAASRGGSSPLTRGKPSGVAHLQDDNGLIPAHAGKTGRPASSPRGRAAHPRSRGENIDDLQTNPAGYGSSPLTRGKRRGCRWRLRHRRLIPAHAGKTSPR